MIVDSFLFFQELDLLEIRLKYLYPFVDKFIIVESCQSFTGRRKEFNFEKNIKRYDKYLKKIIYFKITDFHKSVFDFYKYLAKKNNLVSKIMNNHNHYDKKLLWWVLEAYHRECIHYALQKNCKLNDIIIISDLDEIPSINSLKKFKGNLGDQLPLRCKQYEFKYYLNSLFGDNWLGSIFAPYSYLQNKSLNVMRMETNKLKYEINGGYHFTSIGGVKSLKKKIESWGHQEFNLKLIKNNLLENLYYGRDAFYRYGFKRNIFINLKSSDIFDESIRDILLDYKNLILPKKKKESIKSRIHYRYIQILVYFIHIKNNPEKVIKKIIMNIQKYVNLIHKFLSRN